MSDAADYIPIHFARTIEEAEYYKTLLEDHEINAIIDEDNTMGDYEDAGDGIAILVPGEQLDEAELILEQRSNVDDEFDEDIDDFEEDEDEFDDFTELDPDEDEADDFDLDDLDEEDDY